MTAVASPFLSRGFRVLGSILSFLLIPAGNLVGAQPSGQRTKSPASSSEVEAKKLDLNTASARALSAVPDIGADGAQAIIAARPFTTIDDLSRLKGLSAERLEQIRAKVKVAPEAIPRDAAEKATRGGAKVPAKGDSPQLNINTASYEALAALPSVGPDIANAIIAARPFTSLDELSRIKGISAERLEQLRLHLTIGEVNSTKAARPKR